MSRPSNWTLEYLPLDRPYNIVSVFSVGGAIEYHHCNVLTDVQLDDSTLSYVDLDLDVVVRHDGSYTVEDREQFETNACLMQYPATVRALAMDAVGELERLVREREHIFGCTELAQAERRLLDLYVRSAGDG